MDTLTSILNFSQSQTLTRRCALSLIVLTVPSYCALSAGTIGVGVAVDRVAGATWERGGDLTGRS